MPWVEPPNQFVNVRIEPGYQAAQNPNTAPAPGGNARLFKMVLFLLVGIVLCYQFPETAMLLFAALCKGAAYGGSAVQSMVNTVVDASEQAADLIAENLERKRIAREALESLSPCEVSRCSTNHTLDLYGSNYIEIVKLVEQLLEGMQRDSFNPSTCSNLCAPIKFQRDSELRISVQELIKYSYGCNIQKQQISYRSNGAREISTSVEEFLPECKDAALLDDNEIMQAFQSALGTVRERQGRFRQVLNQYMGKLLTPEVLQEMEEYSSSNYGEQIGVWNGEMSFTAKVWERFVPEVRGPPTVVPEPSADMLEGPGTIDHNAKGATVYARCQSKECQMKVLADVHLSKSDKTRKFCKTTVKSLTASSMEKPVTIRNWCKSTIAKTNAFLKTALVAQKKGPHIKEVSTETMPVSRTAITDNKDEI